MACNLRKDPGGLFDALGATGATATLFIQSTAAPDVSVTAAVMNKAKLNVDAAGKISMTALQKGTNVLRLTLEGMSEGDDLQLTEDCGGGATSILTKAFAGAAPGGADPVVSFRIHGE